MMVTWRVAEWFMNFFKLILSVFVMLIYYRNAHAYLDPGTGFTFATGFLSTILGIVALGFGALVMTFKRWKGWFFDLFKKKKSK